MERDGIGNRISWIITFPSHEMQSNSNRGEEEGRRRRRRGRNRLDWVTVKRNNESTKEIHKFPMPNKGVCVGGRPTTTSKGNGRCGEKVIDRNKCKSQIEQNDVAKYLRLPICDRVWIRKRYLHLWRHNKKKWKKWKKERTILDCVADTVFIALINNQAILLLFRPCCVGGALHLLLSWDCLFFLFFFFSILPVLLSLRLDASSSPSPLSSGPPSVINGWQRSCR